MSHVQLLTDSGDRCVSDTLMLSGMPRDTEIYCCMVVEPILRLMLVGKWHYLLCIANEASTCALQRLGNPSPEWLYSISDAVHKGVLARTSARAPPALALDEPLLFGLLYRVRSWAPALSAGLTSPGGHCGGFAGLVYGSSRVGSSARTASPRPVFPQLPTCNEGLGERSSFQGS